LRRQDPGKSFRTYFHSAATYEREIARACADRMGAKLRFLFDDYVLDDARLELRRGAQIVPVEARVFDLLTYLIRNRERVVSQEDMRMAVWEGRIVSISTISSSMNAVRTAIGDSGNDQRFIRTVPRKGFRFVAPVTEEQTETGQTPIASNAEAQPPGDSPPTASSGAAGNGTGDGLPAALAEESADLPATPFVTRRRAIRTAVVFVIGAAAGALAATLYFLPVPSQTAPQLLSIQKFDASSVPLVNEDTRLALSNYPSRPDHKAVAIGGGGQFHVADGAQTAEKAQEAALQGCFAKLKRPCRVYAAGLDVVWSEQSIPLPVSRDVRTEPLGIPLDPHTIPLILNKERKVIADQMRTSDMPHVLALSTGRYLGQHSPTRREAVRTALERCSFRYGRPCLILAVDGDLTIRIPRTRRVLRTLLPSTDLEIPDADKERVARIYQGREWRALARGETGSWHAIADAPSEVAAIEAALKACEKADSGCRLFAIGNFRVADE
jgi:DNA-binding winged helix-turn-helix (wHTH) protein